MWQRSFRCKKDDKTSRLNRFFSLQLQHPHPIGHLHLPHRLDRDLLLSHEHRPLVQTTRWGHHASAQTSQEKEAKGN